jgi:hypothetical protein
MRHLPFCMNARICPARDMQGHVLLAKRLERILDRLLNGRDARFLPLPAGIGASLILIF